MIRKGAHYGYETKHSIYYNEHVSNKTQTDIGVGTRQQTIKRCGVVKPDREKLLQLGQQQQPSQPQCETGTCPWR